MTHCAETRGDDRLLFCRKIEQKIITIFLVYIPLYNSYPQRLVLLCQDMCPLCACISEKKMKYLCSSQLKSMHQSVLWADTELCRALLCCLLRCRDLNPQTNCREMGEGS